MSLVAVLLIGSSAFALDNTKVSGNAKLYYSTSDNSTYDNAGNKVNSNDLFSANGAAGQAAFGLGVTTDLAKGISAGGHVTALTTLGLQGQLVDNVWEATNGLDDSWWVDQAWIAATAGKTTAKVGRMELDTPYVFTEKWSIVKNTFGAAVLINQDIPDTTVVGAYVGQGNGSTYLGLGNSNGVGGGIAGVVGKQNANATTNFAQFFNGAYAAGVINNSWKPLTAQAWYFDATHAATAYWLQADFDASSLGVKGLTLGAQYTDLNLYKGLIGTASDQDNDAFAAMIGYSMKDMFSAKVAYSQTGKNNVSKQGAGMNLAGTSQSKLYTEAWWNYGHVTGNDTTSYNVTVESPVNGLFDLGLYYTNADQSASAGNKDMSEFTLTAGKSFGALDATLAYVNTNDDAKNNGDAYNTVQAYLTLNF